MQELLDEYTKAERLEEGNGLNCSNCKRKGVLGTKQLSLYRCPPVLVVQLKRFTQTKPDGGFSAMSKVLTTLKLAVCAAAGMPSIALLCQACAQQVTCRQRALQNSMCRSSRSQTS